MDTYSDDIECNVKTFVDDVLKIPVPGYDVVGHSLVSQSHPGKIMMLSQYKVFLKTCNGAPHWNLNDIIHIISRLSDTGIISFLYSGHSFAKPAFQCDNKNLDSLYPSGINIIIAEYLIGDIRFNVFSQQVIAIIRNKYFRDFSFRVNNCTKIQNNTWLMSITDNYIMIDIGRLQYYGYYNGKITVVDNREFNVTYSYQDGKIDLQYSVEEVTKMPIEVIQHFDPKGEFGLLQLFRPLVVNKTCNEILEDMIFSMDHSIKLAGQTWPRLARLI